MFLVSSVVLCFSLVNLQVVNLPERTETGLITGSDKTVRAVHSCNTGKIAFFVTIGIIYLMKLDDACVNHAGSCK